MTNGRNLQKAAKSGRDAGAFIALPWSVIDSLNYRQLSHPARSLLMEIARQFVRDNNGRLLTSMSYLKTRGWNSADVVNRAKKELMDKGFIHETVKGHRPNKASWYALTWYTLDRLPGYDAGALEGFERGAYRKNSPIQNTPLKPSHGKQGVRIVPPHGINPPIVAPADGSICAISGAIPIPSDRNHLE